MATAESAADWDADAQDTLRDASAAEVSLGMARRQLMRSQRHAATARQATDRAQASPWWRMSAPLRVTVQRLRKRPNQLPVRDRRNPVRRGRWRDCHRRPPPAWR